MGGPSKYSPELRERAVRMVQDHAPEYPVLVVHRSRSRRSVAAGLRRSDAGCARRNVTPANDLTSTERQRLKHLEREVIELKRANSLREASAYFAGAELDRPRE